MASRAVRYLIWSFAGIAVVAGLITIGLWSWHAKVLQSPDRTATMYLSS